jgi:hypothetical protein
MSCEISHHQHHHLDATVFQLEHQFKELVCKFGFLAIDHCLKRPGHKLALLAYGVEVVRLHKSIERKCKHISKCHDKLAYADMKILHKQVDALLKKTLEHFVLDVTKLLQHAGIAEEGSMAAMPAVSFSPPSSPSKLQDVVASARAAIRAKAASAPAGRSGFFSSYAGSPAMGDVFVPEE